MTLDEAIEFHQTGKLEEAKSMYQMLLLPMRHCGGKVSTCEVEQDGVERTSSTTKLA